VNRVKDEIRVVIVEDDPMVAEIHRRFISSMPGFSVAGLAADGEKAMTLLKDTKADLMILDIFMPEMDGLETLRTLRSLESKLDVIVVSAAQEIDTINAVIRSGAFDYIVKPYDFDRFRTSLDSYRNFRERINLGPRSRTQEDIDGLYQLHSRISKASLPKGLNALTLERVEDLLKGHKNPLSADETATSLGVSRVTARRYLEFLVARGQATVERSYGEIGRPVNTYRLIP
jgi:two-component system response regulator DctR